MSDNEYERFEITDYDLESEFNPRLNWRRQTKNQAIYGVWADQSDSDAEGGGPELRPHRGRGGHKDYSKPLSFVSGGVQQSGKKQVEKEEEESQITDSSASEAEPEEKDFIQATAGIRTRNMRGNLGNWEAHTKGIGSRLMQKMGYEPGKGLGKDLQGIAAPIEAFLRKGRGAIGAYGPEKAAKPIDLKKPAAKSEPEKKAIQPKGKQWKQQGKTRYVYRTVEEIIEGNESSPYGLPDARFNKVKVIDMTGPEKRVMSGYHALGKSKTGVMEARQTTNFALPELTHNLKVLVEMTEQEIIANDKKRKLAEERERHLRTEKENLIRIAELESDYIRTLETVQTLVASLVAPAGPLTLTEAEKTFLTLKTGYPEEFQELELAQLVTGVIGPLLRDDLEDWELLQDPARPVSDLKRWLAVLETRPNDSKSLLDPYSALIWVGIMPSFRSAVATWSPRVHCHLMLGALETWMPLLPEWILNNVLEQLILPKLVRCVEVWDPLTDHVPIHEWIRPWHMLLEDKLAERVYAIIRQKLERALKEWVPEDRSAFAMLLPWKGYFGTKEMESFLLKNIASKIEMRFSELVINPLQQDMECFFQVWEWRELFSTAYVVSLLLKYFFPKWMQTLVLWLNQTPNFDEILRWYQGWKERLTEEITSQTEVKEQFRRALELMTRATGQSVFEQPEVATQEVTQTAKDSTRQPQLEFKDLVSQKCSEKGIIFAPMPGKRHLGMQVYRVGKLFCYIDRSVCVMSSDGGVSWNPVSLATMIERA